MPLNALQDPVDLSPPKLRHTVSELGRVFLEASTSLCMAPLMRSLPKGDGHTVMTIPGFMGADGSTAMLRRFLKGRGYRAVSWGLGRNASEASADTLEEFMEHRAVTEAEIARRIGREYRASGRKLTLVGWSLGGLYAVALAHRYPQWIRQVITLGTPYGDPRGTAIYKIMSRLNGTEGHVAEESLRAWVDSTYCGELEVPVLALFSETDGVVGTGIARCEADPRFVTNLAVAASHVGFPFNPVVFAVIANHMVIKDRRWRSCGDARWAPLVRAV
ncbi:hypothetical protein A3709_03105 [Halioglobus sp. HI00S01]|uniref:esterase/lipase family protein n=1 Tax=Halioglobus sp. HI00S01 TaxID=1822214 RepID=UPI0007C29703|nr:alpha/beta hydrolase [Halioglobus sp. HI00S01]KZX56786.1 hypothetical protein A3709_03105 [Halioglobus sp. HI00S01]